MDDPVSNQILFDLLLLDALAIGIGLAVFASLRVIHPLARWEARGNVYSAAFSWQELVLVCGIVGWMLVNLGIGKNDPLDSSGIGVGEDAEVLFSAENLLAALVFQFILLGAALAFLSQVRRINLPEAFGLGRFGVGGVCGWAIVVLVPALAIIAGATTWFNSVILEPAWGEVEPQPVVEAIAMETSLSMKILFGVSAVVVAPLCEEFLFRGLVYGVLKRFGERIFANVASSLFFAVIHAHVPSVLPLCLLAVALCIAYEITGCIWVPVVMHALFNALNLGLMWTTGTEL